MDNVTDEIYYSKVLKDKEFSKRFSDADEQFEEGAAAGVAWFAQKMLEDLESLSRFYDDSAGRDYSKDGEFVSAYDIDYLTKELKKLL